MVLSPSLVDLAALALAALQLLLAASSAARLKLNLALAHETIARLGPSLHHLHLCFVSEASPILRHHRRPWLRRGGQTLEFTDDAYMRTQCI